MLEQYLIVRKFKQKCRCAHCPLGDGQLVPISATRFDSEGYALGHLYGWFGEAEEGGYAQILDKHQAFKDLVS